MIGEKNNRWSVFKINLFIVILFYLVPTKFLAQDGFIENFSDPALLHDWEVWTWDGKPWTYHVPNRYSLTDNPGSLRFYLGAMVTAGFEPDLYQYWYYPSLHLIRKFTGANWILETKVTYYLPFSNAKHFMLGVCFGNPANSVEKIIIKKSIDQTNPETPTHFSVEFNYNNQVYSRNIFSRIDLKNIDFMRYYFRIIRMDSDFIVQWSQDGTWYETVANFIMGCLSEEEQFISICGNSWFTPTGTYADYDYMHVIPIESDLLTNGMNDIGNIHLENNRFLQYILSPYNQANERIFFSYPFLYLQNLSTIIEDKFPQPKKNQQDIIARPKAVSLCRFDSLKKELQHYDRLVQETESTSIELFHDIHKAHFVGSRKWVYEKLVDICYQLHKENPDNCYDRKTFQYVEKLKSLCFLQLVVKSEAKIKKGFDAVLLKQEQEILENFSNIEEKLATTEISKERRTELEDSIHSLHVKWGELKTEMSHKNPAYKNFIYPDAISVSQVQTKILDQKTVLLEYFFSRQNFFIFKITKKDFFLFVTPSLDKIKRHINFYQELISKNSSIKKFTAAGSQVFADVLGPVQDKLSHYSRLIIIPDEILYYLPFDVLIPYKLEKEEGIHFLAEDHQIVYVPSATVLKAIKEQMPATNKKRQYEWIAIADPIAMGIDGINGNISSLIYSRDEVQKIKKLFPEDRSLLFLGQQANEQALKQQWISQTKILHFATHCYVNEKNQWSPELLLTKDKNSTEDGKLKLNEIFNLDLNADLIVLSGCQTDRGKFFKSEGMYNLTRAFIYAGTSSVIASLWDVYDRSTAILMEKFYVHLLSGKDRDQALRLAKIDLMNFENGKYRHPYYWAPFVLVGDWQ